MPARAPGDGDTAYEEKKDELKKANPKKGKGSSKRKSVGQGSGAKGKPRSFNVGDKVEFEVAKGWCVPAQVTDYVPSKGYVVTYLKDENGEEKEVQKQNVQPKRLKKKGPKKQKTDE